jgi:eukaryotic-like serine/threonine-protein kinase
LKDPPLKRTSTFKDYRRLGQGALGETWFARNAITSQTVVLKVRPKTPYLNERLRREQATLTGIQSANLQRLLYVYQEQDTHVLVYEFIEGRTLREELRRSDGLPTATVTRIVRDIANGLKVLHEHGVAHRDVSPENVVLASHGAVLVDYDAIGYLDEKTLIGTTTVKGEIAGKYAYMSPEQVLGAPQSAEADIWGLGAVAFEMLTGHFLRQSQSIGDIVRSAASAPAIGAAPEPWLPILRRLLAVDPTERPSAAELGRVDGLREIAG